MPLSEPVYCVAVAFKMTKQVEQRICIKSCVKLEHSSMETIWMIQKATATGNWWLEASSWQCAHTCITSCAEFFAKHQITQVTWFLLQPSQDVVPRNFWLFPKLKSPLKGKRFQTINEIQENTMLMAIGRTLWGPKVPHLKGTKVSLSYVQCFLYLVSSINVSIFHITWLDIFWTGLVY